ncbi:MAG: OmpA family protein [Bdellovibrionales bacterium]|nr:OmpA family protein [Bdellovibrionales bacterium]
MKQQFISAIIFLTFISLPALAKDNASTSAQVVDNYYGDAYNPNGWWGFLGLNLGVVDSETRLRHERDTGGSQFNLKALGSHYFTNNMWLADLGLGLQNSSLGRGQMDKSVTAAYLEFSPRYRFARNWQVGPTTQIFLLGDNDFFEDSESPVGFVGAALNYETPWMQEYPVRIGGRVYVDINVDNRQVTMAMLDLQIGMPFTSRPTVKVIKRESVIKNPEPQIKEKVLEAAIEEEVIDDIDDINKSELKDIILSEKDITFSMGRVEPEQQTQEFLNRLADLLSQEKELFKSVRISGHSDKLGKNLTNEILSYSRAQLVARAFAAAGLSNEKLEVQGLSDSQPLALNKEESFKNRRVEITFSGVKDEKRLRELIRQAL